MAEEKKVSIKVSNVCLNNESESLLRYHENSCNYFNEWEECRRPIEINCSGRYVLSVTERGKSIVFYDANFLEQDEASELMEHLLNATNWQMKNVTIRGVEYPQPRLVAWYGPFSYSYSGTTLEPAEMPDCISEVKRKVEKYLRKNGVNAMLNSVLLNLYRHNKDSVSWHSDDELSMGMFPTIASVSLGDTRRFEMRRKLKPFEDESSYTEGDEYFVDLNNGSLLIMDGSMQKDWQHRVPKEYDARHERINLTFRTVFKLESVLTLPNTCTKKPVLRRRLRKIKRQMINDETPLDSDTNSVGSDSACQTPDLTVTVAVTETSTSQEKDTESSFKTENEVNEEIGGDGETSSKNQITLKTEDQSNEQDVELFCSNDDKNIVRTIDDDSDYSTTSLVANTDETAGKNKRLCTDSQNIKTSSSLNSIVKNDFKIKNESTDSVWTLSASSENIAFNSFELKNLLNYNVDTMNYKLFLDYADAFKNKVLENMDDFSVPEKAELEILCKLTDGTQTEENQKLITKRMYFIVDEAMKQQQDSQNVLKTIRSSRQPSHRHQSPYSQRWNQDINKCNDRKQ